MHYFGAGGGFSPDYFGEVAKLLEKRSRLANDPMVGIMSQGTSGDLHWMDYSQPKRDGFNRAKYSDGLAGIAIDAWKTIRALDPTSRWRWRKNEFHDRSSDTFARAVGLGQES